MTDLTQADPIRLDIWLWRARFLKTRAEASRIISKGKVRLTRTGQTRRVSKPHTSVRPGDQIAFMKGTQLINVEIVAIGTRRGPAPEAQSLYRTCDTTE